jgi:hypothetical protein
MHLFFSLRNNKRSQNYTNPSFALNSFLAQFHDVGHAETPEAKINFTSNAFFGAR